MKHSGPYYGWKFAALARQSDGERDAWPGESRWRELCERRRWVAPMVLIGLWIGMIVGFLIVGYRP